MDVLKALHEKIQESRKTLVERKDALYEGLKTLNRVMEEEGEKPISSILAFIMTNWVVKRHEAVAFRKMIEGRDGFFIEKIDDQYSRRMIPEPDYTGNRFQQLMSVMDDLDMLE